MNLDAMCNYSTFLRLTEVFNQVDKDDLQTDQQPVLSDITWDHVR